MAEKENKKLIISFALLLIWQVTSPDSFLKDVFEARKVYIISGAAHKK